MGANRLWIAGTAILVVGVLALGWMLGISPKLAEAAAADKTRATVDAANLVSLQELAALKEQFEGIEDIRDELDELQKSVPVDGDIPDFIRQLNTLGATYGVAIDSISTGDATAWTPPAVPPLDADGNPVDFSVVPAGFAIMPISVSITGGYAQILAFTQALQHGQRLFLSTDLTVTTSTVDDEGNAVFKGTVAGAIFVLQGQRAREKDETETPTPTPTPTETPESTDSPTPTPTATP